VKIFFAKAIMVFFCKKNIMPRGQYPISESSVADPHPHPHESAWFWSPGSASGIRIPNADSGCGFGLSSVKISAEKRSSILCDKKC
jgi:hypothetical protein